MLTTSPNQPNVYNSLSEVAEADRSLQACGRHVALDALLSVIRRHKLEEFVCIRLLHKHNEIRSGERMVESAIVDDEGFALVTRPIKHTLASTAAIPNSWKLEGDEFVPIEYS